MDKEVGMDLLEQFRKGDTKAFRVLFDQFKDPLLYFSQSMIRRSEVAEEIVSEVFLKLWQRKETFIEPEKMKAFLYISVRNASLDYLKSNHAKQRFQYEIPETSLTENPSVYVKIIRAELLHLLSQEIEKLPNFQKQIIYLSHQEQKNPQEIAEQLHLSVNSVYVNYSRAVQTLKKGLKPHNPNDFLTEA